MALQVAELSLELIETLRPLVPRIKARDKSLADQITRSASSIALNVGEAELSDPGIAHSILSSGVRMAAKKKAKSKTKVAKKAKGAGKKVVKKAKAAGKKVVKRAKATGKKIAKTLLGRIAQVSAQLVLDSGVLGTPPKRAPAKKRARKA